jgi:hypothetical protein
LRLLATAATANGSLESKLQMTKAARTQSKKLNSLTRTTAVNRVIMRNLSYLLLVAALFAKRLGLAGTYF